MRSVLVETPLAKWVREQRRKQAATTDHSDRYRPNHYRLAKLSMHERLTPAERDFVAMLVRSRQLSREQQREFDELWAKYGP